MDPVAVIAAVRIALRVEAADIRAAAEAEVTTKSEDIDDVTK